MDKSEIIAKLNEAHRHILELVQDFGKADFDRPGAAGEWTAKDVFGHLAFWNWEAKKSIELTLKGERPTPWLDANVEETNTREVIERRDISLYKVMDDFRRSHKSLAALIERTPEAELAKDSPFKTQSDKSANATWISGGILEHYHEHSQWLETFVKSQPPTSKSQKL